MDRSTQLGAAGLHPSADLNSLQLLCRWQEIPILVILTTALRLESAIDSTAGIDTPSPIRALLTVVGSVGCGFNARRRAASPLQPLLYSVERKKMRSICRCNNEKPRTSLHAVGAAS